jgi:kynureninase
MSQAQLAGYDPANALVGVTNRPGENYMRHEDIFKAIEEHGDTTALVMFGAVNWASGQFLDMPAITAAGHAKVRGFTIVQHLIFKAR